MLLFLVNNATYVPSIGIGLVLSSQTTFFPFILEWEKGSGTLSIEKAVLASTLVGVSFEFDFLNVLNTIHRDVASCDSKWQFDYTANTRGHWHSTHLGSCIQH